METNTLSHIHQTQKSRQVREKSPIQSRKVDHLSISQEAQKMAQWVEILKQMPDVHLEQIETPPSDIHAKIADQLLFGRP